MQKYIISFLLTLALTGCSNVYSPWQATPTQKNVSSASISNVHHLKQQSKKVAPRVLSTGDDTPIKNLMAS